MVDLKSSKDGSETGSGRLAASLQTCLRRAEDVLDKAGIDGYDVEARLLCEWVTGRTKLDFIARPDEPVAAETWHALDAALQKRLSGMPVHRIMGYRPFYGLQLELSEATLEPRPDTETLVDQVLDIIEKNKRANGPLRILDLGTGTGAIALALLSKLPNAGALGVDVSSQVLETAQQNALANGLADRFSALQSDWFDKVEGTFDIIVSNPPYIKSAVIDQLDIEVRHHDPILALDGGPDGLAPYRIIATNSARHLNEAGLICVEIGYDQALDVKQIFLDQGFELIELRRDLGERDRALAFTLTRL